MEADKLLEEALKGGFNFYGKRSFTTQSMRNAKGTQDWTLNII